MARIAIGGWQHETNTFATIRADYSAFERQDEWPPLAEGQEMLEQIDGVHLPITGAVEALESQGHELVPLLWCSATPCAHVTRDAFETIAERLIDLVRAALPVDGIYLDLHGAMVCEHLEDGEGELLRRLREEIGDEIPVAVSLDLHANITPLMVEHATLIDVFRTYPHIDMGETGARTALLLTELLAAGCKPACAFRQIEFVIPLNAGCSLIEPCQRIYHQIPELLTDRVMSASLACGFHLSDIHDMGPSVLAYGDTQSAADSAADSLVELVHSSRDEFYQKIWSAADGVTEAAKLLADGASTIVLADTQDNPGGGGSGDTTGLLQVLVRQRMSGALFGGLNDSGAALAAHRAGIGGRIEIALGSHSGLPGQEPWPCVASVINLSDGNFTATGPMYRGARMQLGRSALLEIDGVHVVVISTAAQAADQSLFRHLGAEPVEYRIVALKSSVHFRNDFTEMADHILVVAAPGSVFADPAALDYQNVRPELHVRDT